MEKNWHSIPWQKVVEEFNTDFKNGLSFEEFKIRQKKFGKNKIPEEKPLTSLKILFDQFKSPLIYILVIAGIVALFLRDFTDSIIIFGAVFLNTAIGFFQESKTSKILTELKKIVKIKATVIREGKKIEIEQEDLVPGDIFLLEEGKKVPGDGRLVEAHNLKINESALTGEWLPAEKKTEILPKNIPLADRDNMVYMGSIVEDGIGKAICTETGISSEIGKIAKMLFEIEEEKTPYQKRVASLSRFLAILIGIICFSIFILGILFGIDKLQMFLTSVAVAVAAIPEGLPVSIAVILALGMQRILKKKGLVRKMMAAETLGSTSIICTDKTGTLTEGKMKLAKLWPEENKNLILKISVLASEAFIENPEEEIEKLKIRGRPTEKAILISAIETKINKNELEKIEPEIERLPFDPVYKYSAILRKTSENEYSLYLLGAPEKILERSNFIEINEKKEILNKEKIEEIKEKFEEMADKGERVLATAYKKVKSQKSKVKNLEDLCEGLTFVGLISLKDPLRKEVKEAIKICEGAGLKPIIVTGDHRLTARAIAKELGLKINEENIIEGKDLDLISDEEFEKKLEKIKVYARVEPKHKRKIIDAWQKKGKVVAMTGDGINDAPALKEADIGVALGSGTDVAKEASDLILLNDSFSIIVEAVKEGRHILDNIRKVIVYLLSDSFTEVILVSGAILISHFLKKTWILPITAGQILWVNLIEDSLPSISLAFEPEEEGIMEREPEDPKMPLLNEEMKVLIFFIGIFTDFLLLALFFWLIFKRSWMQLREIQTIIFAGLAIDSLFYIFSCKNLRKNVWKMDLLSNPILIGSWFWGISMMLGAIYLPFFNKLLKTVPLNFFDLILVLTIGILNLVLIEATKWYFIAKSSKSKFKK
jgi:Ca2+-transporting ATPase